MSNDTADVEHTTAIPELNVTQATKPGIELYATSSARNRTSVTNNQKAPTDKSAAKARFGSRITLIMLIVLGLSVLLASVSFENGTFVVNWRGNDAKIASDQDQAEFKQDQPDNAFKQDYAEDAPKQDQPDYAFQQDRLEDASKQDQPENPMGQTQAEIEVLKQDMVLMEQKMKDLEIERDAALENARLEKERREKEKQAVLDAAERERDAQAAAALAAHKAQQATLEAEKLAIQQRLEKKSLAEQRERLKQANQQAETRRNLLEEQRKLLVSEWERLAEEKARLERALPEAGGQQ